MAWPKGVPRKKAAVQTEDSVASETTTGEVAATVTKAWSMEQLREIVAAGMSVSEARMLLEDGYTPEDVLSLANLQGEQRQKAAADIQTATAKAMQKAMKPENQDHPGVSAFSYPEGDVKRPRPAVPYEFYWNGYPIHKFPETEHWRELELILQVQPGEFNVLRKDGSKMPVTVRAERDADGKITRVDVEFKVSRSEKDRVPPKTVIIHQMLNQGNLRRALVEGMNEHFTLVMGAETAQAV